MNDQILLGLEDIVWDEYTYPRNHKATEATVSAYAEALGIGAEFPPIGVQCVSNYTGKARNWEGDEVEIGDTGIVYLALDGIHRWAAHHEYNKREKKRAKEGEYEPDLLDSIEAEVWRDEVLDYETHKIELALESAERNTRHGDRLTPADKKALARRIAFDDPEEEYSQTLIAQKLGTEQQRISEYVSDIRARQKAGRDSKIIRLARLGWTHQEIADVVEGLERPRITQIVNSTEFGEINKMLSEGRTMEEIAEHYSIDLALAWALRLEGETDQERFAKDELNWGLRTWDNWYYAKCDERFGDDWPGRIPAQLVAHTLFFFTQQGDLVLDPFCGGTTIWLSFLGSSRWRMRILKTRPSWLF